MWRGPSCRALEVRRGARCGESLLAGHSPHTLFESVSGMSDDENAFVWGGGDGADADVSSDDAGDEEAEGEENSFQWGGGGGGDDADGENSFNWGGGGGGDDDDSDEEHSEDDEKGAGAGEPASSLDLLGSLLSTADMTGAMREPEPEPEPQAQAAKKRNKHARTTDPKAMMRAMKEAQNAQDAGSPKASVGDGAASDGRGAALRAGPAEFKTVVVDSASSRWAIGLEGELEPRMFADAGAELEACWNVLEDFMEDYCDGVVSSQDYAVLFSVAALESSTQAAQELAEVALGQRFGFARCSVVAREVLTMYAQAATTGLVLDLGEAAVTCVPIYEGALLYEGMRRMESSTAVAPAALVDMVLSSAMSSPVDTRNGLFSRVIVVGKHSLDWTDKHRRRFERSMRRRFRQRFGGVIRGGRAKAWADFAAQQVGDLNLEKGDEVTLMQLQGQWCQGENDAGETGVFPLAFVDVLPQHVDVDFPCILKKQFRDKFGNTRFRDEATEFSFCVDLPPEEERLISAWIGGSVLAATEGWEGLWCSTAAELEKCPTLHRDERFQIEQLVDSHTRGIVITPAPDDNWSTSLDAELVVDSWLEWIQDWESELLTRRTFWYFTNQPVSTETAGSRFEDLSKLEAVDRFGETLPEAARHAFYYGQRNAREKEILDAKVWTTVCADSARDTIANSDCDKWHAVCEAQSKYSEPRTVEIRVTVSGEALEPPQKPLNLKWYAWGLGEPTEEEIKHHILSVWQLNRPGAVTGELHLIDADANSLIASTRAVGDFLQLHTQKPVTAAEAAAEAAIAAENESESGSDDDDIAYDELPPNVQGMSILEQLEWKKQEVARRKAARLAKTGHTQSTSAPAARAGDASSAMLDDLLGGGGGNARTSSDDDDDDDEEGAGGLSSALFDSLLVTAQGDTKKVTGEMDFDSMESLGANMRASRRETTGLSLEEMMDAEEAEQAEVADRSVRETDLFGEADEVRQSRRAETTGMSMEDLMDAHEEEARSSSPGTELRQSRRETSGLSLEDLMDAEAEAHAATSVSASHSRHRTETSGMSMEDMMEAEERQNTRGDTSVREKDMFDDLGDDSGQLLSSVADSSMVSGDSDDGHSDGEEIANLPPPPPAAAKAPDSSRREMDFESMMASATLPDSDDEDVEVDEWGLPVIETESNPLAAPEADNVLDGLDDLASMVADETTTHANPLASAEPAAAGSGAPASKAEELLLKARARRAAPEPTTQTTYVDASGAEVDNFDL